METITQFEDRLKRAQSRTRVRSQRVYEPSDIEPVPPRRPARPGWPLPVIVTVVGLALLAGLIAYSREDVARVLPAQDARKISFLEPDAGGTILE